MQRIFIYSPFGVLLFFSSVDHYPLLFAVCDAIASNIGEIISINPSANVFAFGDFHFHHKDSLTYFRGTDGPGEPSWIFSISNDLTQMVNFPTRIAECYPRSPALLELLYYFLLTWVFFLQWLFHHWKFWKFCLGFHWLSSNARGILFSPAFDCVPWEDIFRLGTFAAAPAAEFCVWVQVGIDLYIPHRKYHVKPLSFPWFLAASGAVIVHRSHFSCFHQHNRFSTFKLKFR